MRHHALGTVCRGATQRSEPGQSRANSLDREDLITEDVIPQVHYAPGERPLCGAEGWTVSYTDDPDQVQGCDDCLELVAEDLQDENGYRCRAEPPLSTDQREPA